MCNPVGEASLWTNRACIDKVCWQRRVGLCFSNSLIQLGESQTAVVGHLTVELYYCSYQCLMCVLSFQSPCTVTTSFLVIFTTTLRIFCETVRFARCRGPLFSRRPWMMAIICGFAKMRDENTYDNYATDGSSSLCSFNTRKTDSC